ncbi:hypothetical protein K523DRAFT_266356 [Schizophyllum commune Tattone D]|nr:hypothetical protein K523DRAFT_266356 [Schizophyllum commune Tattone D]
MSFRQPLATPVISHMIYTLSDWDLYCPIVKDTLQELGDSFDQVETRVLQNVPDDTIASCILSSIEVVDRLHKLEESERCLPHLGRDPRSRIVGPLVTDVLQQVVEGSKTYFEPSYARAVYPCQAHLSAASWLFPHYGRATTMLAYPISPAADLQHRQRRSASATGSTATDNGRGKEAPASLGDDHRCGLESRCSGPVILDDEESHCSYVATADAHVPYLHARLLSADRSPTSVPVCLVCVALEDEIYSVMSSALMQRRAFGIGLPLIGFVVSPSTPRAQLVIGWLEDHPTHPCVQVHIAHAPSSNDGSSLTRGIFDASEPRSTWKLVLFLLALRQNIDTCIRIACNNAVNVREAPTSENNGCWRIDNTRKAERAATYGLDYDQRVHRWLADCAAKNSLRCSASNMDSHRRAPSPAQPRGRSLAPVPSRAASGCSPSMPSIHENETDKFWADEKLQQKYAEVRKAQLEVAPITTFVDRHDVRSASSVAKDARVGECDRPTELFTDRCVTFGSYPALHATPQFTHPVLWSVLETLILPRACPVNPLPCETVARSSQLIVDYNEERKCLIYDVRQGGVFTELNANHTRLWFQYHSEIALEKVLRSHCNMHQLLSLDPSVPEGGLGVARSVLTGGLRTTLHASAKISCLSEDSIEMEARHEWDTVIAEYCDSKPVAPIPEDGYRLHSRMERRTPLCRNILLDVVKAPRASGRRVFNHYREFSAIYGSSSEFVELELPDYSVITPESIPIAPGSDLLRELITGIPDVLKEYQTALHNSIEHAANWRSEGAALYIKGAATDKALFARATCDFDFAIADGLVFAEVEDVFGDSDAAFKDDLLAFGIVGTAQDTQPSREEAEIDVVSGPDAPLPESARQIVEHIHRIARERLGQKSASADDNSNDKTLDAAKQTTGQPRDVARSMKLPTATSDESYRMPPRTSSSAPSQAKLSAPPRKWKSVCLPILYREYKRGRVHPLQGMNQARIYLTSATDYYASLDMYDIPVFALATVGGKGRLLCGWAEKVPPPNLSNPYDWDKDPAITIRHRIVDTNCPEWDLSNSSDAIDFASFLTLLRTKHIPRVVEEFNKRRAQFVADWRDPAKRSRFEWTMAHQRQSQYYKDVTAELGSEDKATYENLEKERLLILKQNDEKRKQKAEVAAKREDRDRRERLAKEASHAVTRQHNSERDARYARRSASAGPV